MEWLEFLKFLADQDQADQQTQSFNALAEQMQKNDSLVNHLISVHNESMQTINYFMDGLFFFCMILAFALVWQNVRFNKRIKLLEKKILEKS